MNHDVIAARSAELEVEAVVDGGDEVEFGSETENFHWSDDELYDGLEEDLNNLVIDLYIDFPYS